MSQPLRILVVGAHPADVFDQSGGTMAHHTHRGDHVACLALTHGARIHDKVIADEMFHRETVPQAEELTRLMRERSAVKEREVREACRLLGVDDVELWDVDDAVLLVEPAIVRRVAKFIRCHKPDVVITHFPKENGGIADPHAAAGEIVMHGITLAAQVDGEDDQPPHKIAQTYFFGGAAYVRSHLWSSEGGYYNDVFIDISDVIDKKLAAMDMLDSQGYAGDYVRKRIEGSDGAFGNVAGVGYAEGFISHRSMTCYFLPVSSINREQAQMSDHELLAKRSWRYTP